MAEKPPLPTLVTFVKDKNTTISILDMTVKNVGLGERSATGMFAEQGVFVVSIKEGSRFAENLKPADVILSYNQKEVNDVRGLQEAIMVPNWNESLELTVFRRGRGLMKITMKK